MMDNIYVVIAHPNKTSTIKRSYNVDVLESKDNAIKIADKEVRIRGGKVYCEVQKWTLDKKRSKEFLNTSYKLPDLETKIVYSFPPLEESD